MSVLTPLSSVWLALTAVQAAGMANETASSRQGLKKRGFESSGVQINRAERKRPGSGNGTAFLLLVQRGTGGVPEATEGPVDVGWIADQDGLDVFNDLVWPARTVVIQSEHHHVEIRKTYASALVCLFIFLPCCFCRGGIA